MKERKLYYYIFSSTTKGEVSYFDNIEDAMAKFENEIENEKHMKEYNVIALGVQSDDVSIRDKDFICFDFLHYNVAGLVLTNDCKNHSDVKGINETFDTIIQKFNPKKIYADIGNISCIIPFDKDYKYDSYCNDKIIKLSDKTTYGIKQVLKDNGWQDLKYLSIYENYIKQVNVEYINKETYEHASMDIDIRDYMKMLQESNNNYHVYLVDYDLIHINDILENEIESFELNPDLKEFYKNLGYKRLVVKQGKNIVKRLKL